MVKFDSTKICPCMGKSSVIYSRTYIVVSLSQCQSPIAVITTTTFDNTHFGVGDKPNLASRSSCALGSLLTLPRTRASLSYLFLLSYSNLYLDHTLSPAAPAVRQQLVANDSCDEHWIVLLEYGWLYRPCSTKILRINGQPTPSIQSEN